jgi:hypothetical protein
MTLWCGATRGERSLAQARSFRRSVNLYANTPSYVAKRRSPANVEHIHSFTAIHTSDTGGCDERNTFCASAPALFTPGQYTTTSIVGINSGVRKHLNLLTPSFPLRHRKPIRNPREKKGKKKNQKKSHKQTRKRTKTANLCSEKGPLH